MEQEIHFAGIVVHAQAAVLVYQHAEPVSALDQEVSP